MLISSRFRKNEVIIFNDEFHQSLMVVALHDFRVPCFGKIVNQIHYWTQNLKLYHQSFHYF